MFDFHSDRFTYFKTQIINTEKSLIPFIESFTGDIHARPEVLEIGCAEGGVLKAFVNKGCKGTGVELSAQRVSLANEFLKDDIAAGSIRILQGNILDDELMSPYAGSYDLIILKDVIEHIHEKNSLLTKLRALLAPHGIIFFGFPPWRMPFGGHQQICRSKLLSRLPWIHLLPAFVYRALLNKFREDTDYLMDITQTGISIRGFEKMVKRADFKISGRQHYLISPIYEYKFGIKPVEQFELVSMLPWFRDFFTTSVYYLLKNEIS